MVACSYLDHDWISGLRMRRIAVDTETKSTPPDTESFSPNVEILSEQVKEIQQKLAEHLYAANHKRFFHQFDTCGFLGDRVIYNGTQNTRNTQRLLTGSSPVLMYGDRGAITSCAADSATGSGKGGGGGTDE